MKIYKAIEVLGMVKVNPPEGANQNFIDAIDLGIEALKRIQKLRTYEYFGYASSLEGETEGEGPRRAVIHSPTIKRQQEGEK